MVRMELNNGKLVCAFEGRMANIDCQEMEPDLLARVQAAQSPVVFDMRGMDYVSSAFLRLCLVVSKQVGAARFSMINIHPLAQKTLMFANMGQFAATA